MSDPFRLWLIPVLFVPSFLALWLFVVALLAWVSGWFRLQGQFPDRDETAQATLRMRTGQMGLVGYRNCLSFDVCASGLRVRVMKLLAPFSRPFFVPWGEISVERRRFLFTRFRLGFGKPEQHGRLTVSPRTTEELARLSGGQLLMPTPAP